MSESSAKTVFDYDRHPTSVYADGTARLSISVNNRTGAKKECESIAFIVPKSLTTDPGRITPSVSDQDKGRWSIQRDEGEASQFNATPIPPVTGLDKGEGVLFVFNGVQVSDKTGTATIGIAEMTDEMREGWVSLIKERPEVAIEFKSDTANVVPGGKSTLTWKVEGAARRTLSWLDKSVDVEANGSKEVTPLDTTTYTLTAYGRETAVSQVTVNTVRVKIRDFIAPADPVPMGSNVQLRWRTELATRCDLQENGVSINKPIPLETYSTPFFVTPSVSPTNYKLIAYDKDGNFTDETKTVLLQSVPRLSLKQRWQAPGSFPLLASPPAPRSDHRLFANTNGKELRIFDMSNLSEVGRLPGENVRTWAVSPDGKKLAACKFDKPFNKDNKSFDPSTVMIIDITQGRGYKVLAGVRFGGGQVVFNSEGVFFNSAGNRLYVQAGLWGYDKFTFVFDINDDGAHQVSSFKNRNCEMGAISPDGNKICHPGTDKISIRDLVTTSYDHQYEDIAVESKGRLTQAVWSRDGSKIYLSEIETSEKGSRNRIWIVDPTKQKKNQAIDMKPGFVIQQMILGPPMPDVSLASDMLYVICQQKAQVKPEEPGRLVIAISTATDKQVDELGLNMGETLPASSPDAGAVSADGKTIFLPDGSHICLIETLSTPPSAKRTPGTHEAWDIRHTRQF
jgi:hypothetical protein